MRALSRPPDESADSVDDEGHARAQRYSVKRTRVLLIRRTCYLVLLLVCWFAGGFEFLAQRIEIITASLHKPINIIFLLLSSVLAFITESVKKFGLKNISVKKFGGILLKGTLVAILIFGVLWFFSLLFAWGGSLAWIWCWIFAAVFNLVYYFVRPWTEVRFNKLTPLASDDLRSAISEYVKSVGFPMKRILVFDESRSSVESPAYFAGFGRNKIVCLSNKFIDQHPVSEIIAVVAHEVGHYKHRDIWKRMLFSIMYFGIIFWIWSLFIEQPELYAAFYVTEPSFFLAFFLLVSFVAPLQLAHSVISNVVLRRNEFAADRFAAETTGSGESLINVFNKFGADSRRHPLYVFLYYTHPPVLQRIAALRQLEPQPPTSSSA